MKSFTAALRDAWTWPDGVPGLRCAPPWAFFNASLREDCTGLFPSLPCGKAALFFHCYGKTALGFFHLFPTGRLRCFFTATGRLHWAFSISFRREGCPVFSPLPGRLLSIVCFGGGRDRLERQRHSCSCPDLSIGCSPNVCAPVYDSSAAPLRGSLTLSSEIPTGGSVFPF